MKCNLRTLGRSSTKKAIDLIDAALRKYDQRPTVTHEYHNAIPDLLIALKNTGANIKTQIGNGEFTKAGKAKILHRMGELRIAFKVLEQDFRTQIQL